MPEVNGAQPRDLEQRDADVVFPAGTVVFREGAPGDRMFIVRTGHVRLSRSHNGRDFLMAVVGPGEVFGELAVVDPGPRTSTATALTAVTATAIARSQLRAMIADDAELAWEMLQRMANRLKAVEAQLAAFTATDVAGRIAGQLVALAGRFDRNSDGGVHIACGLQSEDLTQLAGAGHTSGGDALSAFVAHGWIAFDDHGLTVLDIAALRRCAEQAGEAPEARSAAS